MLTQALLVKQPVLVQSQAIFNKLVEGVMSEMTGIAPRQPSGTTVATFLRVIIELIVLEPLSQFVNQPLR